MATIYNDKVTKELRDLADIQINTDTVPNQLAEKIVPVLSCNPKKEINIIRSEDRDAAGAATVYTTPTNRKFYLTSLNCSFIKDAANDHATGSFSLLLATPFGASEIALVRPSIITLTAQTDSFCISFPQPIELAKGTLIRLGAVTIGAGVFTRSATIMGYTVED